VEQGQPVLRLRRHPQMVLVAPVGGDVAALDIGPGRRLSSMVFFHDGKAGRHVHEGARHAEDGAAIRAALLAGGLWTMFRSRPFGRIAGPQEMPAAIFVMAADSRPGAPSPALATKGHEEAFLRGLQALLQLTSGPVHLCHDKAFAAEGAMPKADRLRPALVGPAHPHGLAGFQVALRHPALPNAPVWDVHAEDVAGIGAFLADGLVPQTRLVSVAGQALREARLVRCQPGADLRGLCYDILKPGPHRLLAGCAQGGQEARWLGPWHRQVTALAGRYEAPRRHWFSNALKGASRPLPIIPTAALDHAFGGILPAAPLARAIAANDAETAVQLGALSLLEEDLALADFVTAASPRLSRMLRAMIDQIAREDAA
jgi:Na+-transporting NADH:ubiquinone oxidoreductase subunit A